MPGLDGQIFEFHLMLFFHFRETVWVESKRTLEPIPFVQYRAWRFAKVPMLARATKLVFATIGRGEGLGNAGSRIAESEYR